MCLAVATDETENLLGAEALARMKPTAYFVNASRGNLVDEMALRDVIKRGAIAGVGVDDQMELAPLTPVSFVSGSSTSMHV